MKYFVLLILLMIPLVSAVCVDTDNDGFGVNGGCQFSTPDCDDNSNSVFPGAKEICNNQDDNCDGIIDNLRGEIEIEYTHCQCTENLPHGEYCNDVDDNCNNEIDENCVSITGQISKPLTASSSILLGLVVFIASS